MQIAVTTAHEPAAGTLLEQRLQCRRSIAAGGIELIDGSGIKSAHGANFAVLRSMMGGMEASQLSPSARGALSWDRRIASATAVASDGSIVFDAATISSDCLSSNRVISTAHSTGVPVPSISKAPSELRVMATTRR
jgi:hypothetical protein